MGNKREPFEPGVFYHVFNHGNGDDNIFRCDENYYHFLRKYGDHIEPIAETHAYCLMPNHFHFLLRIKDEEDLKKVFGKKIKLPDPQGLNLAGLISRKFGNLLNAYAKAFNTMFERKGSLFLDNIQRKKVENKYYYAQLVHYIHYNPVHHGLVKDLKDWDFSSYLAFISNRQTKLKRENVLKWFGSKSEFVKTHKKRPELSFDY